MTVLHRLEQRSGMQGELRIFGGRHMGGRLYDPGLGRFLQADPMVQDPLNSQSLNRCSYVLDNPMTYTDPTGYFSVGDGLRLVATAVIAWYAPYMAGPASRAGPPPPPPASERR